MLQCAGGMSDAPWLSHRRPLRPAFMNFMRGSSHHSFRAIATWDSDFVQSESIITLLLPSPSLKLSSTDDNKLGAGHCSYFVSLAARNVHRNRRAKGF